MRNKSTLQSGEYRLNKVSKQIDLLCLGECNCNFTSFLVQYTGQFGGKNQIHNIYVKRLDDKVIFLHEWRDKVELELFQQFDGLVFFVDLVHHLNNTAQTILKNIELLSVKSGINVFRMPLTVIALKGSKLSPKQFGFEKKRLQKSLSSILEPKQILYYPSQTKQNFQAISSKLSIFVNRIFENDPQSIKSTWTAYWKLYGTKDILQPYWTEWQIFYLGLIERLTNNKLPEKRNHETKRSFLNGQSLLKKLW